MSVSRSLSFAVCYTMTGDLLVSMNISVFSFMCTPTHSGLKGYMKR